MSDHSSPYLVPLDPASPWPKFKRDAAGTARTAITPQVTDQAPWEVKTELGVFSPAVVDGDENIYIGSGDHVFYCFTASGEVKWSFTTGELIDSSALLDDKGRVYVPSSDARVYALDCETGELIWTFTADSITACHARGVKSFVDWFEAHIAITPDGTLIVPNDNFHTYGLDRDTGEQKWHFLTGDQTWSCPAVDAATGRFFMGTNYFVLRNVFAGDTRTGRRIWAAGSLGSMVASPLLLPHRGGIVVAAGFDGMVRAFRQKNGRQVWKLGARDHFYSSPVLGADDTVIIPSADGTVYAIDPERGELRWTFDTPEPIRSTPAVDGEGNIYFGNGEGRLYCISPEGEFRWSYLCVTSGRSDVNSSPAISREAIIVGCDDGTIVRVPADYPLTPAGRQDPRCTVTRPTRENGVFVHTLSRFGKREEQPPERIRANQPLSLSLVVREDNATRTSLIDPKSIRVTSSAGIPVDAAVSADKRFITVIPRGSWAGDEGGTVHIAVSGRYRVSPRRFGLKMFGGRRGGDFSRDFRFSVLPRTEPAPEFTVQTGPGSACSVLELGRLAPAMPTILPSYNQLGFDSIHYHLSCIERSDHGILLWGVGAKLVGGGEDRSVVDPALRIRFAVHLEVDGGLLTFLSEEGFTLEFNGWDIPYDLFRVSTSVVAAGPAFEPGWLNAKVRCDDIRFYGPFLKVLGVSDFRTGMMEVSGAAGKVRYLGERALAADGGPGTPSWTATRDAVSLHLAGSSLFADGHNHGILLVHEESDRPLPVNYTKVTSIESAADGHVTRVSVRLPATVRSGTYRAYYLVDGLPALESRVDL